MSWDVSKFYRAADCVVAGESGVLNNFSATSGPSSTDDVNAGYSVGSHWIDTVTDKAYVCVDATAGAAVWLDVEAGGTAIHDHTDANSGGVIPALVVGVYNNSGGTLTKQAPVYITGWHVGTQEPTIAAANADTAATMPAIGLLAADVNNNASGLAVVYGTVTGLNTTGYSTGDSIYVDRGGGITNTVPVGDDAIQKIGTVLRAGVPSTGVIFVIGASRINQIPNFTAADKFWYGGTNGTQSEGTVSAFARTLLDDADAAAARATLQLPFEFTVFASDMISDLTVGANKISFRMPRAMTLTSVRASMHTAGTGGVTTVDILKNGASILSTKLTVDATEETSETAATPPVISDGNLADNDKIAISILGVAPTTTGNGLSITFIGTRA